MGRRSFAVRDVTEILMHWQAGHSIRHIARSLGVDRNTVRKYVHLVTSLGYEPRQTHLSVSEWAAILQTHCPELSQLVPRSGVFDEIARFHELIDSGLQTNTATTVWQRLHDEHGLRASLRSFRRYVDVHWPERRCKVQPTVLRDDPLPGQEAQVDYGYLGLWYDPDTGRQRKLWAFSMVLSYSRYMFVCVTPRMDQASWLQAHADAFAFFGGVPALLLIDNLRAGVVRADLYDPQLNRGYEELAAYYDVLIDPCRAGHPKDKPRVERPMPYIRDSFFQGREFDSLLEINQRAITWCQTVAGMRLHGTTHQRPCEVFEHIELATLRPLPSQPFEPVTWTQAKVAPDCHAQVARTLYSIPHRYQGRPMIGQTLAVRLSPRTVEFYLDRDLLKTHVRSRDGRRQTDWNDYPPEKALFFQRTPDWCRTQASQLGPAVAQAVEHLLAQHHLHYLRQCQGIIRLAEKYGAQRLDAACQRALDFDDPTFKTIRNILHDGLETSALPSPVPPTLPAHAGAYLHGAAQLLNPTLLDRERKDSNGSSSPSAN